MDNVLRGTVVDPDTIYGKSAYEIALMHGFDGTEEEWLQSLVDQNMFVEASREAAGRANDSAGASATSAQEAFNHASSAYSSMENAQIASATAQKAANAALFNADRAEALYGNEGIVFKRLENLEAGLPASAWLTDDSVAYQKTVPANANPYAAITKIGGMSYKTKNLIPFPYNNLGGAGASQTKQGVTATVQDDGSVVLNGTFSGTGPDDFVLIPSSSTLPSGGYIISGVPAVVNNDANRCCLFVIIKRADGTTNYVASYATGASFTLEDGDTFSLMIRIQDVFGTQTNVVIKPMLELGNVETAYQPYFEGLRSSPVTSVTRNGSNFVQANMYNIYGNLNTTVNDSSTLTVKPDHNATIEAILTNRIPRGTYTITNFGDSNAYIMTKSGDYTNRLNVGTSKTFEYDGVSNLQILFYDQAANTTVKYKLMLNAGSTAVPYEPYHDPITTPLPAELLTLEGYGEGIDESTYNYIDWRPAEGVRQWVQKLADGSTKITDLSDVLSDDNLFEVEGGGTLTFDNEHQNAVPSTVLYQLNTDA